MGAVVLGVLRVCQTPLSGQISPVLAVVPIGAVMIISFVKECLDHAYPQSLGCEVVRELVKAHALVSRRGAAEPRTRSALSFGHTDNRLTLNPRQRHIFIIDV